MIFAARFKHGERGAIRVKGGARAGHFRRRLREIRAAAPPRGTPTRTRTGQLGNAVNARHFALEIRAF